MPLAPKISEMYVYGNSDLANIYWFIILFCSFFADVDWLACLLLNAYEMVENWWMPETYAWFFWYWRTTFAHTTWTKVHIKLIYSLLYQVPYHDCFSKLEFTMDSTDRFSAAVHRKSGTLVLWRSRMRSRSRATLVFVSVYGDETRIPSENSLYWK